MINRPILMKANKTKMAVLCITFLALILTSCGSKGPRKGEDLKGDEALEMLAGSPGSNMEEKCWKLVSGKDFLSMMCFSATGTFRDQTDYKTTYTLNGASIVIKDYKDLLFTIVEISDKKMTLSSVESGILVYEGTSDKPVASARVAGNSK
jgi:hypothetical protein